MKVTDELVQKSNGLISLKDEVSDWTGKHYLMFDDGGVELEVGEFLYGLVRVLKPNRILETGTYTGISAMYMAQGLKDNGFGTMDSLEIDLTHIVRATELWKRVGVDPFVRSLHVDSKNYILNENDKIDILFLDSEPGLRFDELVKFYPYVNPGGFIFIHDLHRHMSQEPHEMFFGWPFGELPKQIKDWVKDHELWPMHFPTPRGMTGFYKPQENDFKWN